jgi:hypothetical protein
MANFIDKLLNLFTGRSQRDPQRDVRPASQDPYGDPGDSSRAASRVKPASQDPYGDPADKR